MKKFAKTFYALAALIFLLAACGAQQETAVPAPAELAPEAVVAEGHFASRDNMQLYFTSTGRVGEVLINKGDAVQAGDPLVRLADREPFEANLTAAQLERTQAQQAYDDLLRTVDLSRALAWQNYLDTQTARIAAERAWEKFDTTDYQGRIDDAGIDIENRKTDLNDAQDEFDKYKNLDSDNATRKNAEDKLDAARKNYDEAVRKQDELINAKNEARAILDAANASEDEMKRLYDNTKDGADPDQLALASGRLDNANAQVAAAQKALDNTTIIAPFDGVIVDVNVSAGEFVNTQTWTVQIADFSQWYVETSDLTELEVVRVSEGQKVKIIADALPGVEMIGVVTEIAQSYKSSGGDILYTVKIYVAQVDPLIRWGMTVEATFEPLK
jgi:multidrug resistance efflux pump